MPVIRKRLFPDEVYPSDIRYDEDTGQVQSNINGTWTDNPAADPRNNTLFPARITADTDCDAAESIKDAFKGQIDKILTLISESNTAFTIAGAILALFEFGPWGVLIVIALAIAHVMLDAGATALTDALTTTVYHTFVCILLCRMEPGTGRLKVGSIPDIDTDLDDQVGGLGATILKAMVGLAGEAGMNNLAAIGTSTGDCSDCDCRPPCASTFTVIVDGTDVSYGSDASGDFIQVTSVLDSGVFGGYAVMIATDADDHCCTLDNIASTNTGATGGVWLWEACGGVRPITSFSFSNTSPFAPNDSNSLNTIAKNSTTPFVAKWYFKNP